MELKQQVSHTPSHYPWIKKYRPTKLTDIKGQKDAISMFNEMLDSNQPIHFLFYGPPGTGKTSSVLSFCNELYGKHFNQYVLSINASYDRTIKMVREKIKPFCKQSTNTFKRNGKQIDYKFIILDEADTLTQDAQNALRRCIEIYSYNTRFCFMCNYVSNLISPILSRCSVFHFLPIPKTEAVHYLQSICEKENVCCAEKDIQLVYDTHHGDLRSCLTTLQSVHNMYGEIQETYLNDYLQIIPSTLWDTIYHETNKQECKNIVDMLYNKGYSIRALLNSLIQWLLKHHSPEYIYTLSPILSKMEKQLMASSDNHLLLHELVICVNKTYSNVETDKLKHK